MGTELRVALLNDGFWRRQIYRRGYIRDSVRSMIVKRKSGYFVVSEGGKNLGGPYASRNEAVKRLKQVEYLKKHKKGGK